jgi:uncharacterized protein YlxW (UPF0749 family)
VRRPRGWSAAVAVVSLSAGVLLSASASTAHGTDLRAGRRLRLAELVTERERRVASLGRDAAELREQVLAATRAAAGRDDRVSAAQDAAARLAAPTGLVPVVGPGLEVSLDDAPRGEPGAPRPGNPSPDDLVVHEQDVHAVMNALWAGGAEAMSVMGDRVIGTSSVRCVGNTLLLHGAVYSPPFVIRAIGDADRLAEALRSSPGVALFRTYVEDFGLGYEVSRRDRLTLPAYDGPLDLRASRGGRRP